MCLSFFLISVLSNLVKFPLSCTHTLSLNRFFFLKIFNVFSTSSTNPTLKWPLFITSGINFQIFSKATSLIFCLRNL